MAENTKTNIFFSSFTEKMLLHFIFVVEFASKISSGHTQILRRFETWGRPGIKSCWNNAYHQGKNPHIINLFCKNTRRYRQISTFSRFCSLKMLFLLFQALVNVLVTELNVHNINLAQFGAKILNENVITVRNMIMTPLPWEIMSWRMKVKYARMWFWLKQRYFIMIFKSFPLLNLENIQRIRKKLQFLYPK